MPDIRHRRKSIPTFSGEARMNDHREYFRSQKEMGEGPSDQWPEMIQDPIPKRIIQTGKSHDLSMREQAAVSTIRLHNPDFEYLFFDDAQVERFIERECPEYLMTYHSFPVRIQRYDFFRYLAVFKHGGFYFDLDVFLVRGLSDLLAFGCVFPFEGLTFSRFLRHHHHMDWQLGNYAFGAASGHPFLKAVIDNCVKAQENPSWAQPMMKGMPFISRKEFLVMNTTGPGLLSRTFAEKPELAATVRVLFPEDVCDVRTWNGIGKFGIHMMAGSWRVPMGFLRRRLAMYLEAWTMGRLLKQSRKLGKTRDPVLRSSLVP
jgi:hypothetical protein